MTTQELPKWDLTAISDRMVIKHGWNKEFTDKCIEEYKKFVFLIKKGNKKISPPLKVDDIWHEHILFTKDYFEDTKEYLGFFLHHQPHGIKHLEKYDFERYASIYSQYFEGKEWMNMFGTVHDNENNCSNWCKSACSGDFWCDSVCGSGN
jgi:hypothetical protein